jgi:flagellar export protein FliJ
MAFHFPLDSVLHFRKSIEHQQELKLRAANQRVARVRHMIEDFERRMLEFHFAQVKQLTDGTTAAELTFELRCEAQMLHHRRELEQQLIAAEKARDQQREVFQNARRACEILEAVRDRQLGIYRKEALRREQRNLDDLFLMQLIVERLHSQRG